jgi:AraC family transcriptional regulator, regulatory protein of adaptative response / DNA-3-methyladenine glycosylase II
MVDHEGCVRAVEAKDARFDGWFVTAVTSTGIYCRPSCPAMTPKRVNMTFHPTSAAAQAAGFRACKRCRPDASPGSPEWNVRADLVARSMRLIADGVVDRDGVTGLANRLGYGVRQIERVLHGELGAGPLALARAQRAQSARVLIETTELAMTDIAFASGFASIRQFNDTVQQVFATSPTQLRQRLAKSAKPSAAGSITVRLSLRQPYEPTSVFGHLAATAVPGVEEWHDGAYRRTMQLPHGWGIVALTPHVDHVAATFWLEHVRDLGAAVARVRWLCDLDADPQAVDAALGQDALLARAINATPGRRVPRCVDGNELALRIVIGQQISTKAARTVTGRLVAEFGSPIDDPAGGLTHLFPTVEQLAAVDPSHLPMPTARQHTFMRLASALAHGDVHLDPGVDRAHELAALGQLKGIGPWTLSSVAMRALGDPDAFLPTDLGIIYAARQLGIGDGKALVNHSERWRPWRSVATQYLWGILDHPINSLPDAPTKDTPT